MVFFLSHVENTKSRLYYVTFFCDKTPSCHHQNISPNPYKRNIKCLILHCSLLWNSAQTARELFHSTIFLKLSLHFVRSLPAPTQQFNCLTRDPPKRDCMWSKAGLQMNLSISFGMTNLSPNLFDALPYFNVAFGMKTKRKRTTWFVTLSLVPPFLMEPTRTTFLPLLSFLLCFTFNCTKHRTQSTVLFLSITIYRTLPKPFLNTIKNSRYYHIIWYLLEVPTMSIANLKIKQWDEVQVKFKQYNFSASTQ